ncbi:MAG: WYL domain-containing protein [Actinomycetota bacterium]|jgi:predicted DNA-binding transcriptional regulator YafY|nr:WYL domain-containing protein [Actinomycetota bacterium]
MTDAVERIVNLALHLAHAAKPVGHESIRRDVFGYPKDQDEAAYLRMFERDKDELRAAGFVIEANEAGLYSLDSAATFVSDVGLSATEIAAVRAAGTAALSDPSFPFAPELRLALAKLASRFEPLEVPAASRQADESPSDQAENAAALELATRASKRVEFVYTNSIGRTAAHTVEPYGLFLRDGRWYMVGRDIAHDEPRVYTVARMADLMVSGARPKSPDFSRPAGFDVSAFIRLPFQYGDQEFSAALRFDQSAAWRAKGLASGLGVLRSEGDETVWSVPARDDAALLRWVVENGPGISVDAPTELADRLVSTMRKAATLHG